MINFNKVDKLLIAAQIQKLHKLWQQTLNDHYILLYIKRRR